MSVVSIVVAVVVFVPALVWLAVGVAGLRGTLRRNRWVGVRSPETLSSDDAFAVANRVAAPGTIGAAVILLAGGLLTLGVGSAWSFLFGVGAAVGALIIVGAVSGYAVRAARWASSEDSDAGCACCSGADAHDHGEAPATTEAATAGSDATNAADCGESSCASCTLRGACLGDDDTAASRV
ncbi:SdpI family protein [Gordonia sp. NPDC003950]